MFPLTNTTLTIALPSGLGQKEFLDKAEQEIVDMIKSGVFYGEDRRINDRITPGRVLMLA